MWNTGDNFLEFWKNKLLNKFSGKRQSFLLKLIAESVQSEIMKLILQQDRISK